MNKEQFEKALDVLGDDVKPLALDALDEYLYFKDQIERLRKMPLIRVSEKNPEKQMVTPAGKLIKDYSNVLDAKRGTLIRLLHRVESSAADELISKLSEFE